MNVICSFVTGKKRAVNLCWAKRNAALHGCQIPFSKILKSSDISLKNSAYKTFHIPLMIPASHENFFQIPVPSRFASFLTSSKMSKVIALTLPALKMSSSFTKSRRDTLYSPLYFFTRLICASKTLLGDVSPSRKNKRR